MNRIKTLVWPNFTNVILLVPAILLYFFSNELTLVTLNSLMFNKICALKFNETICQNLKAYSNQSYFNEVEEAASLNNILMNLCFLIPAIVSLLMLISISDKTIDYRIPLFISVSGSMIQSLICIFSTFNNEQITIYLIYLAQIMNGILGGGSLCFISSCFSYVSIRPQAKQKALRITHDDNELEYNLTSIEQNSSQSQYNDRSIKYSICEACILIGQFFGSFSSGYLIDRKKDLENYTKVYIICTLVHFVIIIYLSLIFYFCMKVNNKSQENRESLVQNSEFESDDNMDSISPTRHTQTKCSICLSKIRIKISTIYEVAGVLIKKREKNYKYIINSLFLLYFLAASNSIGIMSIQYLYLIKEPISLTSTEYGMFKAANTFCKSISLLIILPILKRKFNVHDLILLLGGLSSEFITLIIFAVASIATNLIWIGK
jgi:hypothetical protein